MSDIMSVLASSYATAPLSPASDKPYTAVAPASYQGTWSGTYWSSRQCEFTISEDNGSRAQVRDQRGATA